MNPSLYEGKKIASWTLAKIAEALCDQLNTFDPVLEKDAVVYGKKTIQITFRGEISVALDLTKQRFPNADSVQMYIGMSLSPNPYSPDTHVLNTLDMAVFLGLFPELKGKHFFTIQKTEPWDGSSLSKAAQAMRGLIESMLQFESCFHLLLDDEYTIQGTRLDSKELSITHHLNQVKAYRLAEIYGHPEKLDEAIEAIKKFAAHDQMSKERLEDLRAKNPEDAANWLYTQKMLEKLRN